MRQLDETGMIGTGEMGLILLAAGASRRFGGPKLIANLQGRPLLHHSAATFSTFPFASRIVVSAREGQDLDRFGFTCVIPPGKSDALAQSITAGMAALDLVKLDSVMIALGDMPFITPAHIEKLIENFNGSAVASTSGGTPQPPAIFGRSRVPELLELQGDQGAKDILRDAPLVKARAEVLMDVDTPEDLAVAKAISLGKSAFCRS